MRNQRAGQATLILLDTVQVKPINDKFRSFTKGARLAVDVIQYEPAMERVRQHACVRYDGGFTVRVLREGPGNKSYVSADSEFRSL
jgi:hypothetical protein